MTAPVIASPAVIMPYNISVLLPESTFETTTGITLGERVFRRAHGRVTLSTRRADASRPDWQLDADARQVFAQASAS